MTIELTICDSLENLLVGIVEFDNIVVQPASPELADYCQQVAERAVAKFPTPAWEMECQEIRRMLRHGKFRASGRSKPAQEYLASCVRRDGRWPTINGPVDLINAVSLDLNLPISLLSLDKCSRRLHVARGGAGESYRFNSAGQELDLTDLIAIYDSSCDPMRPVGSPVKDSMAGKIESSDRNLVALIYTPNSPSARSRCAMAEEILKIRLGLST